MYYEKQKYNESQVWNNKLSRSELSETDTKERSFLKGDYDF